MNMTQLQQKYPSAHLTYSQNQEHLIYWQYEEQYLAIDASELSQSDTDFISIFLNQSPLLLTKTHSTWYDILYTNQTTIPITGTYRCIQFQLDDSLQTADQANWLDQFKTAFTNIVDAFFTRSDRGILVQQQSTNNINYRDLKEFSQLFQDDFSQNITFYLGQFLPVSPQFSQHFHWEKTLFQFKQTHATLDSVNNLANSILPYLLAHGLHDCLPLEICYQTCQQQEQWQHLVTTLWKQQGNLSATAKLLYIHRNTLQYRIDRFEEETSLQLREPDDLLLAYLLTFHLV